MIRAKGANRGAILLAGLLGACSPAKRSAPSPAVAASSVATAASAPVSASAMPAAPSASAAAKALPPCSLDRILWAPGAPRLAVTGCVPGASGTALLLVNLGAEPGAREIEGDDHDMSWNADGSRFTTGRGLLLDAGSFAVLSSPEILDKDTRETGAGFYPKSSFSADGKVFLVTNAQSRMWFLDALSGKVKKVTREFVAAPATGSTLSYWSPSGATLLAVADPGSVRLMTGHGAVVKLLAESGSDPLWHPRSTRFLLESATAGLLLYKADGALLKKLAPPGSNGPLGLRFSPDGSVIVAREKLLREDGSVVRSLDGVTSLDFSPDSRSLAWTDSRGVWVGAPQGEGSQIRSFQPGESLEVRWLPDSKHLVLEDNLRIEVWDTEAKKLRFPAVLKEPASRAQSALGLGGGWLALAGRGATLLRVRDGQRLDLHIEMNQKRASLILSAKDGAFCGDIALARRLLAPSESKPLPCAELLVP